MATFDRVIWVVLDGVGAGELPDAREYGDLGSNTLGNLARAFKEKSGRPLNVPNLEAWGLGNITPIEGVPPRWSGREQGAFGRAAELSRGKDTTSGHWEMAGLVMKKPFATYPDGFARDLVDRWCRENGLPGVLGNKSASGTEIIEELGAEHLRTGKPILYTSADSVWQVAAHEQAFGLDRLYSICESARQIGDTLQLGRVIARPFIGDPSKGAPFKRTYNRKDYSQLPFAPTYLDHLLSLGVPVLGIGKIGDIFAGRGIPENIHTDGNTDGIRVLLEETARRPRGLLLCNLVDFDMLYGHRRDVRGFAGALEEFDQAIPELRKRMDRRDLLILASDHGNDPTFRGTDHTREFSLLLAYSPAQKGAGPADLGTRESFGDVGATVVDALAGDRPPGLAGRSFLPEMGLA